MKRCPACNRIYTDESLNFCADDGTQLVGDKPPAAPFNESPDSIPTLIAPAPQPIPPPSGYQPPTKKRKWLALIALAFALLAMPFLFYSLSQPLLREFAFRNAHPSLLFMSLWGVVTTFGFLLTSVSVIAAIVALGVSFKKPAQYGGRLLAGAGAFVSVLLIVLVIGAFAFRRLQGPTHFAYDSNDVSNYNSNSNDNTNRSDNFNSDDDSAASTNSDDNYNSSSDSSADSTGMSETDKYRLFYAASKSGDIDLQRRAAKKIGIIDSSGMPTSTYQSFVKGTINWAMTDRAWVQTMDTPAKGRAYVEQRL